MITHISLDLDGTLADERIDKVIWNEEIPKLYAEKHKISLEDAKQYVFAEYYKKLYIDDTKRWTDIEFWFTHFDLDGWDSLLAYLKKDTFLFDDTIDILNYLSKKYTLVITSSSEEKFLRIKLECEGIKNYFKHVFSAPSSFNILQKNKEAYEKILAQLGINPNQIVHVGNEQHVDYDIPSSLGITCFLLDRSGKRKGEHVIHSLLELKERL